MEIVCSKYYSNSKIVLHTYLQVFTFAFFSAPTDDPSYKEHFFEYDIAVIEVSLPFYIRNPLVNPICLPPTKMTSDDLTDTYKLTINGFGGYNGSYDPQEKPNHRYFDKVGVAENSKYI